MDAKEARRKSVEFNEKLRHIQYVEVIELITKEVEKGGFNISYFGVLRDDVKANLKLDGFCVNESHSGVNEISTDISW